MFDLQRVLMIKSWVSGRVNVRTEAAPGRRSLQPPRYLMPLPVRSVLTAAEREAITTSLGPTPMKFVPPGTRERRLAIREECRGHVSRWCLHRESKCRTARPRVDTSTPPAAPDNVVTMCSGYVRSTMRRKSTLRLTP